MITEDYVSYELAKLLKEKGFNELTAFVYSDKGELLRLSEFGIRDLTNNDCDGYSKWQFPIEDVSSIISVPTIQMAMKWLREVHNIHINLDIHWLHFANQNGWVYIITKILENGIEYVDCKGDESDKTFYSTYEEACEAAIKYCLENLI